VLREFNKNATTEIATWLPKNVRLELTPLLGDVKINRQTVKDNGGITVKLPEENSFVLYKYDIIN
jgi:hypothetical protein